MVDMSCISLNKELPMRLANLYVITNLVNGKQYYGWAFWCERRWTEHKRDRGSKLVYRAINKYGIENFKFKILCEGEVTFIKRLEQIMIEQECSKTPYGYNLTDGGEGVVGFYPSKETREKMSRSQTGEHNGMYGKTHSKETRQRIREKVLKRDPSTFKSVSRPGPSNPRAIPVLVNGIKYGCISDAAKYLKCHPQTLRRYYRKHGSSFNYESYDSKRHPRAIRVLVNGKEYGCIKEAALAESINYSTLRDRFQRFQKANSWPRGYTYLS